MRKTELWKRAGLFAATLCGALGIASAASADVSDLLGNWVNSDSATTGVTRMVVSPAGPNRVRIRVFGQCHPSDCDWGEVVAHSYFDSAGSDHVKSVMAVFDQGFARRTIVLRERMGDRLGFEILTDFTDGSGRRDYDMSGRLDRGFGGGGWPPPPPGGGGGWPPPPPPGGGGGGGMAEDCVGVNPGAVQAAFVGGAWKVVDGGSWLLDYGGNAAAAHHAADVIHHYHFDQQCFVKRPNASMMYWKTGDHVPSGNTPGQDCIGLNPATTHAEFAGGAWKVVDGGNWLLDYGSDHGAALHAAGVIHNYNLNRQCFIERPHAPMMYWLSQ
jgi:hypothetical protein